MSDVPLRLIVLHIAGLCPNLKELGTLLKIISSYFYAFENNFPAKVLNSCVSF